MGTLVVSNISKAYKRYPSKWARAREWVTGRSTHEKIWVLRDINFRVEPGDAVGIVGMNGAGKSTLLKIITGTTQPTTGNVATNGRVAALLELGMGFHPDFTGRQNVFTAGQLLGLRIDEIVAVFHDIEAFAEIGDYIDRPVRLYSSGMQMRLAFSVATAVRPDILIVDEALSVGDAYFQHKSFARIREFREQGTTLLLVSHDGNAIKTICDRAILLKDGCLAKEAEPEEVMDYYSALLADRAGNAIQQTISEEQKVRTESGTFEAQIVEVSILNQAGQVIEVVPVGELITLQIRVLVNEDIEGLVLGFGIKDRLGQVVFGTNTFHTGQRIDTAKKGDVFVFNTEFVANLGIGSYSIQCALVRNDSHLDVNYHWIDRAKVFEMINFDKDQFVGSAWYPVVIDIEQVQSVTDHEVLSVSTSEGATC